MKKGKLLRAAALFFAFMLCFTILSRAANQMGIAIVRTERPQSRSINHDVRASGRIVQNQELAVTTEPDQRVKTIYVSEGERVEKGDLLFEVDTDLLAEKILNQEQELEKQQLQVNDAKSQKDVSAQQKASAQAQASENYSLSVNRAGVQLSRAKQQLAQAQEALKKYRKKKGKNTASGDSSVEDSLEQTVAEKSEAYIQAEQELTSLQWKIENEVNQALLQAGGASLTVNGEIRTQAGDVDAGGLDTALDKDADAGLEASLYDAGIVADADEVLKASEGAQFGSAGALEADESVQLGSVDALESDESVQLGSVDTLEVDGSMRFGSADMPLTDEGVILDGAEIAQDEFNGSLNGADVASDGVDMLANEADIIVEGIDILPDGAGIQDDSVTQNDSVVPEGSIGPDSSGAQNNSGAADDFTGSDGSIIQNNPGTQDGVVGPDGSIVQNNSDAADGSIGPDGSVIQNNPGTQDGAAMPDGSIVQNNSGAADDSIGSDGSVIQNNPGMHGPAAETDPVRIEQEVRNRYAQALQEARDKVQAAKQEKAQAEAALVQYQQERLASESSQNAQTEKQLIANVETARQAYEDAAISANEAQVTNGRAVQAAGIPDASNSSDRMGEITYEQMELSLQKLEKLQDNGGKIYAPADGLITKINITTGEKTMDTTAILMADLSKGYRFTAELTKDQEKYIGTGDLVSLSGNDKKNNLEELPVESVAADDENEEIYHVTVQIPDGTFEIGMTATLEFSQKSKSYATVVPISALHLDEKNQAYVLVPDEYDSVMGTELRARKVSVTVLEKNEMYAALAEGSVTGSQQIITGSDKTVDDGSRVRIEN